MSDHKDVSLQTRCGHQATGFSGETYSCMLATGHAGLHAERVHLRDHISVTNWGDDGLAPWATKDEKERR